VSLTTTIDSAKSDVGVPKSADFASRPKFQIERSWIGSDRNDARRVRGFVSIISGLGSCYKKETQAPKKPSFGDEARHANRLGVEVQSTWPIPLPDSF
jgi:hypothetical protein